MGWIKTTAEAVIVTLSKPDAHGTYRADAAYGDFNGPLSEQHGGGVVADDEIDTEATDCDQIELNPR